MTRFTVTIDTESQSFQPDPAPEIRNQLRRLAATISETLDKLNPLPAGTVTVTLRDRNGHAVGFVEIQ